MRHHVICGLERIDEFPGFFAGRRLGLMTNPTGIDHLLRSSVDLLNEKYDLRVLLACEHGIRGAEQAGGGREDTVDEVTGLPVFSTYGSVGNCVTPAMAEHFDTMVFDIQDVGARFYTYQYSLSLSMVACAKLGKSVVVLDRVNLIGGAAIEGTVLDERRFSSFVGKYATPTRQGLTIGEFALWVKDHLKLDLDLAVIPLQGWRRDMLLPELDIPWTAPSPNCPTYDCAMCYIGTCVFEGTNVSEGRGTTLPFQMIGAPWINGRELAKRMNAKNIRGVRFRECAFSPTFSKYKGEMCRGVQMHIVDERDCLPVLAGLTLVDEIRAMHGDRLETTPSLDYLLGTDRYRLGDLTAFELMEENRSALEAFDEKRKEFYLY